MRWVSAARHAAAPWLLALCLVAGCQPAAEQQLADARRLLSQQQHVGAMLVLKSLLQQSPDLAEARWLLGKTLLDQGDAAAAEAELRRAYELRHPATEVVPMLARAQLATRQYKALVQNWATTRLGDPAAHADLQTSIAQALAAQGDSGPARATLAELLQQRPDHLPAQLLQARLELQAGEQAEARGRIDAVLAARPDSAEAWALRALLALQAGRWAEAIDANRRALAAQPTLVSAHVALLGLHLAQGDMAAARQQHAAMRQSLPGHAQTLMFEGQLALLDGEVAQAQGVFQRLLKTDPDNPLLLQSAGVAALRLGLPAQAERSLARALQLQPQAGAVRRALAQAQLEQGQAARALNTLEPLLGAPAGMARAGSGRAPTSSQAHAKEDALEDARQDAKALGLAAQALLITGQGAAAEAMIKRAAALAPDDPQLRTRLALTHLARGQPERSVAELQQVAGGDSGIGADLALMLTHLRQRAWPQALAAVDGIDRKRPGEALGPMLRGQVLLAKGDSAGARKAFDEALQRQPGDVGAASAQAQLDMADGKTEAALARMAALVAAQPGSVPARLAQVAMLRRSGGDAAQVAALLDAAVKAAPADRAARLALIDHHQAVGRPASARDAAQQAVAALPDDLALLGRLGQAQLAAGEPQQAQASFSRWLSLEPGAAMAYLGLAEAQLAAKDAGAARRTLARGLDKAPSAALHRLAGGLALREGRQDDALAHARSLQTRHADDAAGWLLAADVAQARGQPTEALALLRQAAERPRSGVAPQRLHKALQTAGQAGAAQAMAADWLRRHPKDALFHFYLGDLARAAKDWPAAERHYQAVASLQPANALVLNNLAWVLLQQRRPGALALAQQAVQAMPEQPALLDTLAAALAAHDRWDDAIRTQQRALALAPDDAEMPRRLARLKQKQLP
jgi:predicted Zn-dependent protease